MPKLNWACMGIKELERVYDSCNWPFSQHENWCKSHGAIFFLTLTKNSEEILPCSGGSSAVYVSLNQGVCFLACHSAW